MEENNKFNGNIEGYKEGFVRGWAEITTDSEQPNEVDLYIDDNFISKIDANLYREDLKDASVRSGIAGFLAPVPIYFCDNHEHLLTIKKSGTDQHLSSKKLVVSQIRHLERLNEDIIYAKTNKQFEKHKRIIFIAGFSNLNKLLNYQVNLIKKFQTAGFYVIYILASDQAEKQFAILSAADKVIIRRNSGYDFGSWANAFRLCQKEFIEAEEVIWANDSIIGPIAPIEKLLNKINNSLSDIWAITDSYARKYHFQSYFWGLKKKENQFQPIIDAFFLYRCGLPIEKEDAITNYEVEALSYFKLYSLSIDILFPEQALIPIAEKFFISELAEYKEKWQPLFEMKLTKSHHLELNNGLVNLASTIIKRKSTNSSHMYWNALIEQGFPFIKIELLTLNPSNYPFPHQFRKVLEKNNAIELIDDLSDENNFSTII